MRKKILVAIMAVLVCVSSMPSAQASAQKAPGIGTWGGFWPDWTSTYNYYDDSEDSQEDNYSYGSYYDDKYTYNYYDDDDDNYDDYDDDNDDNDDDYDWYDVRDSDSSSSDDSDDDDYDSDDSDDDDDYELDIYDIAVNPKKKEIKKGKSFYISIVPSDESEWDDFTEIEWDELCEDNIESIEYTSTKKSVAYVNSLNGKVKARKKGTATIKTTVNLANEESVTFKTKVTVKK